jgi:hypothetical protein
MPEAMNPPSDFEFEFDSDGPIYTTVPVEKEHFPRILCGFFDGTR